MSTATVINPSTGPTAKEKKYDRQLRLWGANGQEALENSHVLLINGGCGVVGAETLKNLILPSVGQFTVYDTVKVEEADLGVNFFLEVDGLGQPRAKVLAELLGELNPDVKGHWNDEVRFDAMQIKEKLMGSSH
jgi:amyloid beta precursor protein binding protein 1